MYIICAGDSSDLVEDVEEDHISGDASEPTIVSGLEVQLKEVKDGKYRFVHVTIILCTYMCELE